MCDPLIRSEHTAHFTGGDTEAQRGPPACQGHTAGPLQSGIPAPDPQGKGPQLHSWYLLLAAMRSGWGVPTSRSGRRACKAWGGDLNHRPGHTRTWPGHSEASGKFGLFGRVCPPLFPLPDSSWPAPAGPPFTVAAPVPGLVGIGPAASCEDGLASCYLPLHNQAIPHMGPAPEQRQASQR